MRIPDSVAAPATRAIRTDASDQGWSLLARVGLVFTVIGALDVALAWIPPVLGSAEWEFGTIGATLNGLPLPALGLCLILASSVSRRIRWQALTVGAVSGVLVTLLLAMAFVYVTVIPLALANVNNDVVRTGLLKSIVKVVALLVLYLPLFGWISWQAFRVRPGSR